MKMRANAAVLVVLLIAASFAGAQSTEFSYQGQLQNSNAPATGTFDFEFALFGSALGGSQLGPALTRSGVNVVNGIFSVSLDFGNQFDGSPKFLEIRVKASGGGAFTTLFPRQNVASSPYSVRSIDAQNAINSQTAVNATNATNLTGPLGGDVTGTQGSTTVAKIQGRGVSSTAPLDGQVLKYNNAAQQWIPGTDLEGSGSGGGTITGVTVGAGLTGGGSTGSVEIGRAHV